MGENTGLEIVGCLATEGGVCKFHYAIEERRKVLRRDVDHQQAEINNMEAVKKVAYGLTALSGVLLTIILLNFSFTNDTRKESQARDVMLDNQITEVSKQVAVLAAVSGGTNKTIVDSLAELNGSIKELSK